MLRILIIKLSAFGDIIHSLSVVECLREYSERNNREVELHWLIEKKWSPILENYPGIHNLILTNTKYWRRSFFNRTAWKEMSAFWSSLRKDRYDLIIDINGLIRSSVLARMARAGQRVGFSRNSEVIRERHSVHLLDKTYSVPSGHVVDQTVGLLEKALNIKIPGSINPYLPPCDNAIQGAKLLLARKGLVPKKFAVIAAGGGWKTKLLDEKLIAEFCDCVNQSGMKPVLSFSGEAEKARVKRISEWSKGKVEELGDLPVDVFIEVLRMSGIVIGPDTGTVHAASAVLTPTVSYYGPSSARYSGPRRSTDRVVQLSPHCGPCFKRSCDRDLCNNPDVRQVLDEIRDQLGE